MFLLIRLIRRIRLAWLWALSVLIYRNRETIIRTLRAVWYRVRGVEPPDAMRARAVDTTSRDRMG